MKKIFFFSLLVLALASCGSKGKKSYDEMGSSGLTTRTENLQANLRTFVNKGTMIGQEYATLEGVGWRQDTTRQGDIYSISDNRAAVNAYELQGIESGSKSNVDGFSFDAIRRDALEHFRKGGLVIMTWAAPERHEDSDAADKSLQRVADFLSSLENGYGIKAPVLLIPCPLDRPAWYSRLTPKAYKKLTGDIIDKLKDLDVTNAIYGCTVNTGIAKDQLDAYIPDGVDVLNMSCSGQKGAADHPGVVAHQDAVAHLSAAVKSLVAEAQERNIVPGLTLHCHGCTDSTFFSKTLLPVIHQHRLSFVLFGANSGDEAEHRFSIPYPGCGNVFIDDFMTLVNDKSTIFLSTLNGLYLEH